MRIAGVDVASEALEICLERGQPTFELSNSARGHRALLKRLRDHDIEAVILEATGGYERKLADFLCNHGLVVLMANPRNVRDFARACGQLAKTDAIDAELLIGFAQAVEVRPWQPPSANLVELRQWTIRRAQLVEMRTQERNRLRFADDALRAAIEATIAHLDAQVAQAEQVIEAVIDADAQLVERNQRLQTVPGVAQRTSAVLLAELSELGEATGKQMASLAGVAPHNNDSGKSGKDRHIQRGRARVRTALYMAALSGVRHNEALSVFYNRLLSKGKPKKVALVACMNKLVRWLNAMERDKLTWSQMHAATA